LFVLLVRVDEDEYEILGKMALTGAKTELLED
jgi:hypothetical protein